MRPVNTSRIRIRVAVRNIAAAAVADGLTTRVVDVMAVGATAAETAVRDVPITRRTCRAAMPRVPPLVSIQIGRAQMLRAATPSPVLARKVADITVAASGVAVTVVSELAAAVAVDVAAVTVELVAAAVAAVAAVSRVAHARVVAAAAVAPAAEAIPAAAAASRALPDSGLIQARSGDC